MQIIAFDINKILIEKKENVSNELEIKTNLSVENITEDSIQTFGNSQPVLKFDFLFSVNYTPNTAKIEIKGTVVATEEKDNVSKILKEWKNKKFQNQLKLPLFNFIMKKCNIKAVELEDELNLPLHVPFPQLSPQDSAEASKSDKSIKENKPTNYTG